jgi:tRNA-specific 2-thiouridylase
MKQNVLVAITGGLESCVAAYLLKKQGYNVIGIALQLFEEGEVAGPFQEMMVTDFTKIKAICTSLEIPFYAVNAVSIFKDQVLDFVIGRVLSGQTFEPIVFYNRVLIEVLTEKAAKFNTNLVATGHYAKILKNQKTGMFEVLVANDLENDQSYLLSRLDHHHLEGLLLPLAEIRKAEVEKIGKLLPVEFVKRSKVNRAHIMHDPRMVQLIESRVPKDLRKPGTLYKYIDDQNYGEHPGIFHYFIGKKNNKLRQEVEIDPELEVVQIVPYKGNVFLGYNNSQKHRHALIVQFKAADGLDMSVPIHAYVKKGPADPKLPCIISFKNNKSCVLEYKVEQSGVLIPGQYVALYSREGEKGKVLGSGIIEVGGIFANGDYHTLPNKNKKDPDAPEEDLNPNDKLNF